MLRLFKIDIERCGMPREDAAIDRRLARLDRGEKVLGTCHVLERRGAALEKILQQPEAYISNASGLFDKTTGDLTNEDTKVFFTNFGKKFAEWIGKTAKAKTPA